MYISAELAVLVMFQLPQQTVVVAACCGAVQQYTYCAAVQRANKERWVALAFKYTVLC